MARTKTKVEDTTVDTAVDEAVEAIETDTAEVVVEAPVAETSTVEVPAATTSKVAKATTAKKAVAREYDAEELIKCRSIVQGKLLMTGPRSKIAYTWYNVGDVIEVEYQDLTALLLSRSRYLYKPCFVIEDEELMQQSRWKDVAKLYESLYGTDDINKIINLPPAQLKKMLNTVPKSFWRTLTIEVSTRIENGTYDSINRIKVFDEVCGTDLMCLIN